MKNLFRYLIICAITLIALACGVDKYNSCKSEVSNNILNTHIVSTSCYLDDFIPAYNFFLPSYSSSANALRIQGASKRCNSSVRLYYPVPKFIKIINAHRANSSMLPIFLPNHPFTGAVHKLITLGKLII